MRKFLLLPVLLWACGGSDAKVDTVAAPAALTTADVAGTYTGSTMAETTDSVLSTWTGWVATNAAGGLEGKIVNHAAPNDTVTFTQTIVGDSVISESAAYLDPLAPKGSPQLQWTSVAHRAGNDWSGTLAIRIAGSDSVVQRAHWKGTRTP